MRDLRVWQRRTERGLALLTAVAVTWAILVHTKALHAAYRAPVRARHGMVVSASDLASRVGLRILQEGGNAVDAAVATGFALAVTLPEAGNLGGGGFMVIRFPDGRATTIDYRERAPLAATRDMYLDSVGRFQPQKSTFGYLASGTPGSVAGLCYALQHYGTLPLQKVIAPAVELARKGYRLDYWAARTLAQHADRFRFFPGAAAIFLKDGTEPYSEGDLFVQKDLAHTLQLIADQGPEVFYTGEIADKIASEFAEHGGLITKRDLAEYRAIERPPVTGYYRGHRILSMGPPSSGGIVLVEALNILEGFDLRHWLPGSSTTYHLIAEALRRAFADRAAFLGDADFVRVPVAGLTSKAYADSLRRTIALDRASSSASVRHGDPWRFEAGETTHYVVVDAQRMAVSVTTTINGTFGSHVVVPGTGFLMNNEMDDFSARPGVPNMFGLVGSEANAIAPGKRMLSSMTPTIVEQDDSLWFVIGSPGGPRIISTVLQAIINAVDFEMNAQAAISAPRVHHQWLPDVLYYEPEVPIDVRQSLVALGHRLRRFSEIGRAKSIMVGTDGALWGGVDPRGPGLAVGY